MQPGPPGHLRAAFSFSDTSEASLKPTLDELQVLQIALAQRLRVSVATFNK